MGWGGSEKGQDRAEEEDPVWTYGIRRDAHEPAASAPHPPTRASVTFCSVRGDGKGTARVSQTRWYQLQAGYPSVGLRFLILEGAGSPLPGHTRGQVAPAEPALVASAPATPASEGPAPSDQPH